MVIDPAAVYHSAITPQVLPNAVVVVDHFHPVKLANDARRRVTWTLRGRRGRKLDPEWANRRRLLTGRGRLSDRSFARMWNELLDGDPTGEIFTAWIAKDELRALLALARTSPARHVIARRLGDFYHWCAQR